MSVVIATVDTIDKNSVCEDPNCAQRGELMKDHHVVHKAKGTRKGVRGECPHCKGPLHNVKDDARLIAFSCLLRQAGVTKKTPIDANILRMIAQDIDHGKITAWADRSLLLTVLGSAAAPKAVSPVGPGTPAVSAAASSSVATPTVQRPAPTGASVLPAASATPTTAPTAADTVAVAAAESSRLREDRKRKLREELKRARVTP